MLKIRAFFYTLKLQITPLHHSYTCILILDLYISDYSLEYTKLFLKIQYFDEIILNMDIDFAKKVAEEAVKEAGNILMDNFNKDMPAFLKGKNDIVTDIDIKSEKVILDAIKKNFPEHQILSEEAGLIGSESKYVWIVDPIDGTINYYHKSAPFRVGLCLLEDGKSIISAIYNPIKDHLYSAQKGKGAYKNGQKIMASSRQELKDSVIMFHLSSKKEARNRTISILDNIFENSLHMRMFGSSLAAMTYIAEGKFDVFFNLQTSSWDILPGALIIEESGGKVTDINGGEIDYNSKSVLATNGRVHEQMLKLLKDK